MVKKAKLIEVLDYGLEEMHGFVDHLTVDQRMAVGAVDRWSAKDTLAHFTEWTSRLMHDLELAGTTGEPDEPPARDQNFDEANAEIFALHQWQAWEDILAWTESTSTAVRAYALAATDQELNDPQPVPWREARPLWRTLVGSAVEHPLLHLAYFYIANGNLAEAARLQETLASRLVDLDNSPAWRGAQVYNLACIRALSGEKEKALANLSEAFHLAPELIEWSKQDPDLVSLRQDPAFEALYAA